MCPKKGDPLSPISRSELLDGALERCKTRMSARTSPYVSRLWNEALTRKQGGWLEGPFPTYRDAILGRDGSKIRCNPAARFRAPQGGKPRAVDDLKQSLANRAAQVLTLINLPTWNHFSSLIKLMISEPFFIGPPKCSIHSARVCEG